MIRVGGQRLQMEYAARKNMAGVATSVAGAFLQEDWFHLFLERVKTRHPLLFSGRRTQLVLRGRFVLRKHSAAPGDNQEQQTYLGEESQVGAFHADARK